MKVLEIEYILSLYFILNLFMFYLKIFRHFSEPYMHGYLHRQVIVCRIKNDLKCNFITRKDADPRLRMDYYN